MRWRMVGWGFFLVLVSVAILAGTAHARDRDPEAEKKLAADLDPALGARFHQATALLDADKAAESEAAFRAIHEKAPEHAPTLWRLSGLALHRGDRPEAIAKARDAMAASGGVWQAKSSLAGALVMDGAEHPNDVAEASRLVAELQGEHPSEDTAAVAAMVAITQNNQPALRSAVEDLRKYAPDGVITHHLAFILAVSDDDLGTADRELTRAVELGFPAATADEYREKSGIASRTRAWRWAKLGGISLGAWLVGLGAIFLLGWAMSRSTLRAIDRFDGRDREAFKGTTRRIRAVYAWLIGAAALYYYISVPVVIALVVLLAGGLVYGAFQVGHIPIKLILLVGIVALVTVWAMLRSLFVRAAADEDPGRPLGEGEAPALWGLLREVAGRVGTRPVDAVYMTLATEVAVIERGSMAARLRDAGKRSLILGVGALDGMTRQQLRAILAHEYGHFSNRDTAGGGLAMVVQASLLGSIVRIAEAGGAAFYNPAWHFVRTFYGIFLRITLGASRLREIMADQFAAAAYGARAFADGLRHIVRRSLELDRNLDILASRAQAEARPIASLYTVPEEAAASGTQELEAALAERMEDAGSPYDSHPPPGRRIAWVSKLAGEDAAQPDDADAAAWTLFQDRAALEREMTALANQRLRAQGVQMDSPPPAAVASPLDRR